MPVIVNHCASITLSPRRVQAPSVLLIVNDFTQHCGPEGGVRHFETVTPLREAQRMLKGMRTPIRGNDNKHPLRFCKALVTQKASSSSRWRSNYAARTAAAALLPCRASAPIQPGLICQFCHTTTPRRDYKSCAALCGLTSTFHAL